MNLFRRVYSICTVTAIFLACVSCGQLAEDAPDMGSMVNVSFSFTGNNLGSDSEASTKAPSGNSDAVDFMIYSLDVYAINSANGIITGKANMQFPTGQSMLGGITQQVTIRVPEGQVEYVVFANMTADDKSTAESAVTKSGLTNLLISNALDDEKLFMSGSATHNWVTDGTTVNVSLKRAISRIQLFLDKRVAQDIKITSVKVKNLVKKSYAIERSTSYSTFSEDIYYTNLTLPTETDPDADGTFLCEIPVYENFTTSPGNQTYLELTATYNSVDTKYNVYLDLSGNNNGTTAQAVNRNTIYRINGTITGKGDFQGIEANLTILPWVEKNLNIDVSQTRLEVGKTRSEFSYRDVIPVSMSVGSNYTVSPSVGWLTVVDQNADGFTLEADLGSYPRADNTATVKVTANNITKVISVVQRPDVGTLSFTPSSTIILSPASYTTQTINITSLSGGWDITGPVPAGNYATISQTTAASATTGQAVTFGYAGTTAHGNTVYTLRNKLTLEEIPINVANLLLEVPDQINVSGKAGDNTNFDISAIGGSEIYLVVANTGSSWLQTEVIGGNLKLTYSAGPDEEVRECYITIAHKDDLAYTKTVKVVQDSHVVVLDPFDYFVGTFLQQSNADLDIAVTFDNTGNSDLDKNLLGYGFGTSTSPKTIYYPGRSNPIAEWGGDPVSSGNGESVIFYMSELDIDEDNPTAGIPETELPRYVNVYFYCYWRSSANTVYWVDLTINFWKGGEPDRIQIGSTDKYRYGNKPKDGIPGVDQNALDGNNPTRRISPISKVVTGITASNFRTSTQPILYVRYDRVKHLPEIHEYSATDPAWIGVPTYVRPSNAMMSNFNRILSSSVTEPDEKETKK